MATRGLGREPKAVALARSAHVNVLVAANRFTDELERICRDVGISHHQYVALWVLCLSDDGDAGLPMGAVADGLLNRASDTSRLVDRLVQAGLVERLADPLDRRVVRVRATEAGRDVFARVTPVIQRYHRRQWAALSPAELQQLDALLVKALWPSLEDGNGN